MRVHEIKNKGNKRLNTNITAHYGKIISYGNDNLYPQYIDNIVSGSVTGLSSLNVYRKFIAGKGFDGIKLHGKNLNDIVVNTNGETILDLVKLASSDLAKFGGFAIHVNYFVTGEASSYSVVPFEFTRLKKLKSDDTVKKIYVWDNWDNSSPNKNTKPDIIDILDHDIFSDIVNVENNEDIKGSIESYSGQILYISNTGIYSYPMPLFEPALTDMSTEEGISNTLHRNARNSMLGGGLLVNIDGTPRAEDEEQDDEVAVFVKNFIGDENAATVGTVTVKTKEEAPLFVDLSGKNFDDRLKNTQAYIPDTIGRSFTQPPILRAVDVGSNFGANAIKNAYDFYNSITSEERTTIASAFMKVLQLMPGFNLSDIEIEPLSYNIENTIAETLTGDQKELFINIINSEVDRDLKLKRLKVLFNFSDEELSNLV